MNKLQMNKLQKRIILSSAIVSGLLTTGLPAEAINLNGELLGGFGFSGTVNMNPVTGLPNDFNVTFIETIFEASSGDFDYVVPAASSGTINQFPFEENPLDFNITTHPTKNNIYLGDSLTIQFGNQEIDGITGELVFNIPISEYERSAGGFSTNVFNFDGQLSATATFNGVVTNFEGSASFNDTITQDGTFSMSFESTAPDDQVVPEPSALVGLVGVLGLGALVKKRKK